MPYLQWINVEVIAAKNLMPEHLESSCSSTVVLSLRCESEWQSQERRKRFGLPELPTLFEVQERRTSCHPKNVNPVWKELLDGMPFDYCSLDCLTLYIAVFNEHTRDGHMGPDLLGDVRIRACHVPFSLPLAEIQAFPLENRSPFTDSRAMIVLSFYHDAVFYNPYGLILSKKSYVKPQRTPSRTRRPKRYEPECSSFVEAQDEQENTPLLTKRSSSTVWSRIKSSLRLWFYH